MTGYGGEPELDAAQREMSDPASPRGKVLRTLMDLDVVESLARQMLYTATVDPDPVKVRAALRHAGLAISTTVDQIAARCAEPGAEEDSDSLLDRAEQFIADLDITATRFQDRAPDHVAHVQHVTATLLSRLWTAGRLIGVPLDAWPDTELARALLHSVNAVGAEFEQQ